MGYEIYNKSQYLNNNLYIVAITNKKNMNCMFVKSLFM